MKLPALVVSGSLLVAGVIHLLPLLGVLGASQLAMLYGLDFSDPSLAILMRHRAVLFGLLGAFLIVAAFRPVLQPMGFFAGLASVLAFLLIAASTGNYNDAVAGIVTGDIVALLALAMFAPVVLSAQAGVRALPLEVMPGHLRRLDLHSRQLQLSESLDAASRGFAAAVQLVLIELKAEIAATIAGAGIADPLDVRAATVAMGKYAAAATLMPYGQFAIIEESGSQRKITQGEEFFVDLMNEGQAKAGKIDNRSFYSTLSAAHGGHTLMAAWQRMYGESAMPYLDGSNPYLVNYAQVNDFAAAQERSWQLRYDYDFKAVGLNGLSFLTRYINGDHVKVPGSLAEGKEWERDSELKYQVQGGRFKNLSVRLRNSTYRSNYEKWARDMDETRDIVSYNFSIF